MPSRTKPIRQVCRKEAHLPVYSFSLRQYYEKCGTERAGYDVGLKLTSYPFLGTRPCTDLLLGSQASKGSYPYHHYEHCRVWLRLPPRSQGCVQHSTEQPSLRLAYSLSHTWAIALVLISRREHALQEATCSCSGPLHLCPFFQKQVYVLASSLLSWPGTLSRKP